MKIYFYIFILILTLLIFQLFDLITILVCCISGSSLDGLCRLVLEQAEGSINNKNKHIEDLKNINKALQAKVEDLNKTNTSALFDFSKVSEEKKKFRSHVVHSKGFHSLFDNFF